MTPTRVLVVGCGSIGQRHARLLAERRDVAVGLCDTSEPQLAEAGRTAPGADAFDSLRAALTWPPDAVFVCTPNRVHAPVAIAALEAGAHVFCEKPLADTIAAGRAIIDASQRTGRLLHVGYVMRCHPMVEFLRERVSSGAIGNLVSGRAMVGTYQTLTYARTDYRLAEPNALVHDYTHELDLLGLFFGPPKAVVAEKACLGELPIQPDPNVFALIVTFASGAVASVHMDYVQHPQQRRLELYGDRGHLAGDFVAGQCRHYEHGEDGFHARPFPLGRDDLFRDQIDRFLSAMRTDREPMVSGDDALGAMALAHAAIRSADERRWVEVAEVTEAP